MKTKYPFQFVNGSTESNFMNYESGQYKNAINYYTSLKITTCNLMMRLTLHTGTCLPRGPVVCLSSTSSFCFRSLVILVHIIRFSWNRKYMASSMVFAESKDDIYQKIIYLPNVFKISQPKLQY